MPSFFHRAALASAIVVLAACGKQESAPPTQPTAAVPAAPPKPAPIVPSPEGRTTPAITAEDFASRLQKISGDAFEGRKPGTIGERMSTAWIKDQFEQIGLKPGNGASWIQTVPMVETTLLDANGVTLDVAAKDGAERFAYRTDMIINALDGSPSVDIENSDIVFAGYGVVAPEQNWNDYAGLDVKGKTVVVLVNDPGFYGHDETLFKGRALTYYGRWTYKFEEAARQGAAACLIVHDTAGAGYPWDVVINSWSGPQPALPTREDPGPRLKAAGWLTTEAAQRLFAKSGANFDEAKKSADVRGFTPSTLDAKLTTHFKNRVDNTSSENVIGMIRGSTRPDEAVVYSAHWDHLGKDPDLKGDQIYNGAIDNGTGIAGLLEIAESVRASAAAAATIGAVHRVHARGRRAHGLALLRDASGVSARQDRRRHQHGRAADSGTGEGHRSHQLGPVLARRLHQGRGSCAKPHDRSRRDTEKGFSSARISSTSRGSACLSSTRARA